MTEISRDKFNQAMRIYKQLIGEMPADYQEQFPVFDQFISPIGLVNFMNKGLNDDEDVWLNDDEDVWLSITAERRINALLGPHANAMLMAWAAQRMESKGVKHE